MTLSARLSLLFTLMILAAVATGVQARGKTLASVLDNVPRTSERLPGFRQDSVRTRMATAPLHDVEGLWEVAGQGSLMAIERTDARWAGGATVYAMVIVRSSSLALRPGTVIGYLTPGAEHGCYDSRIYGSRSASGISLSGPGRYTARLSDDSGFLSLKPYGRTLRLNWWRLLLPYMYRHAISPLEREPRGIEGFRRVWPAPFPPLNPRYL